MIFCHCNVKRHEIVKTILAVTANGMNRRKGYLEDGGEQSLERKCG